MGAATLASAGGSGRVEGGKGVCLFGVRSAVGHARVETVVRRRWRAEAGSHEHVVLDLYYMYPKHKHVF